MGFCSLCIAGPSFVPSSQEEKEEEPTNRRQRNRGGSGRRRRTVKLNDAQEEEANEYYLGCGPLQQARCHVGRTWRHVA